jgi:tellurite resistance protein TerC
MENIFIYHIVVEAFKTPRAQSQKALLIVVSCQIVFQLVFFMGLACFLRNLYVLPYLLGVWLIYVAVQSLRADHDEFDVQESLVWRSLGTCFGDRLVPDYHPDGWVFSTTKDGRISVTMLFPLICVLLLVDFLMEVDVTLTKIESFDNMYVAFTSSVSAGFAVPELFFVSRDIFKLYPLLKYGVSFILLFFGVQLLCHELFVIPDVVGIAIIIGVLILLVCVSKLLVCCGIKLAERPTHSPRDSGEVTPTPPEIDREADKEGQASTSRAPG